MKILNIKGWMLVLGSFCLLLSCSKKPTDYRSFLDNEEIVYPGVLQNPATMPGNGRIMLTWHPSTDPSIAKYVVYWNNYADSLTVPAVTHDPQDTVRCLIDHLEEYNYSFYVVSYDESGNKSITTEIDNAKVYGSIYQVNLINRPVNLDTPFVLSDDQSEVQLKFLVPDTINITTRIKYTNQQNQSASVSLGPDQSAYTLKDYKFGTPILYQSSYIPVRNAIDTFLTATSDTFPSIFRLIECDKSLFREMHLPNDMSPYESGTNVTQLWDGNMSPKEYPNIFHSDGAHPLPQHFSFDMGKVYTNLNRVQEIGRGSAHNPAEFEVWGIADTTNAITQLAGNDPGWKAEALSKGWTLLKDVVRTDAEGIDPFNATLVDNPPPVRFIMIRVLKTVDNSDYVNLSQLTFWDKN